LRALIGGGPVLGSERPAEGTGGESFSTNQLFEADRLEQLRVFSCSYRQLFLLFSRLPSVLCPLQVAPAVALSAIADMLITSQLIAQALKTKQSFPGSDLSRNPWRRVSRVRVTEKETYQAW
jgi:hypothetical protein